MEDSHELLSEVGDVCACRPMITSFGASVSASSGGGGGQASEQTQCSGYSADPYLING